MCHVVLWSIGNFLTLPALKFLSVRSLIQAFKSNEGRDSLKSKRKRRGEVGVVSHMPNALPDLAAGGDMDEDEDDDEVDDEIHLAQW